ncbi:MAG: lasso peptide biosynthesis B2 protein [Candidatus Contendobacter sp.]
MYRDIFLFVNALRLAWIAQAIQSRPLSKVIARLEALRWLPRGADAEAARRATLRACGRLARWTGGLDTCLIRALVLGALLADREGVVLHLGFRPGSAGAGSADGHAWLTLNGEPVLDPETGGAAYLESLRLPMRRASRDTTFGLMRSKRDSKS